MKFFSVFFNIIIVLLAFAIFAISGGWIYLYFFTNETALINLMLDFILIGMAILLGFIGLRISCIKK